eukprot:g10165.t1
MMNSTLKLVAVGTLAAAAPSHAGSGSGLDFLASVQQRKPRVAKQDIWLEDRSAGRLQNTRGHLAPTVFDHWQGYYSAEVAAFSC